MRRVANYDAIEDRNVIVRVAGGRASASPRDSFFHSWGLADARPPATQISITLDQPPLPSQKPLR